MPLDKNTLKQLTKELENLRHVLLNGILGIERSFAEIEHRLQYMSNQRNLFKEMVEKLYDDLDKTGCFRTPKPPNP